MSMRQKEPPEILLTPVQMVCAVWEVSSRRLFEPEGRAGIRFLLSFPAACNSLISDITSPSLGHQLNHALISIPPVRGFLPLLFLLTQRSIAGSCHLNTQPLQLAPIWLPFAFDACNLLDMDKRWHVWGILTEDRESTRQRLVLRMNGAFLHCAPTRLHWSYQGPAGTPDNSEGQRDHLGLTSWTSVLNCVQWGPMSNLSIAI